MNKTEQETPFPEEPIKFRPHIVYKLFGPFNRPRRLLKGWHLFLFNPVYILGRRVLRIFGSLIRSKPVMELTFNPPVVNFGEVRRVQLAKSTLLTSTLVSLGSFQVCSDAKERVGCGKQTGSYRTYSILGKTAASVPEFTEKDLPSAELQPRFLRLK